MEELVDIVNQLQDVFSAGYGSPGIDLPQIVVVGTQSAGKSSVLEHIVGKSFLPRGNGIVTRCPLVLQLVHAPEETEEYAVFQHNTEKIFTDYSLISKEIESETVFLAGNNKDICHDTINLKIFSPSVLNLTLVDLPGLMKVPVGDQPKNIEEQTRTLILKFIKNPNSIILAITPANVDMATSDSLKLAKEVDPQGTRTLAVLTKLDLMDEGTDAWDMLHGKVVPVKLGIIGVVNRSQKDINEDKRIEDSLKHETAFLKKNYKSISANHGSPYLTKTVQALLVNHIQNCMPDLKERIHQNLMDKKTELALYKNSKLDKKALLLELVFRFAKIYISAIKGYKVNNPTGGLYGGAKIHSVFQNVYASQIKAINPLAGLEKTEDMITAIYNANAMDPAIFVPEVAFQLLARIQVEQFRGPSLTCVDLVYGELNKLAQTCLEDKTLQLDHYAKLKSTLGVEVTKLLQDRLPIINQIVTSLIDIQAAHINTIHPDFLAKQIQSVQIKPSEYPDLPHRQICINLPSHPDFKSDKMSVDCDLVKELIKSYMTIVGKIVEDTVPKMIIHSLVNFVIDQLLFELVQRIHDKGNVEYLLSESPATISKRKELEAEIDVLEKADSIINSLSITMIESMRVLKSHNNTHRG